MDLPAWITPTLQFIATIGTAAIAYRQGRLHSAVTKEASQNTIIAGFVEDVLERLKELERQRDEKEKENQRLFTELQKAQGELEISRRDAKIQKEAHERVITDIRERAKFLERMYEVKKEGR